MNDQAVLKCRNCDVDAETTSVEGDVTMVSCPCCGKTETGGRLHKMLREQENYLLDKIIDDALNAELVDMSSISNDDFKVTHEPGKEPLDPGWGFHFTPNV